MEIKMIYSDIKYEHLFPTPHFSNTNRFSPVNRPISSGNSDSSIPERSSSSHCSSWAWAINESRAAFGVGMGNLELRMVN